MTKTKSSSHSSKAKKTTRSPSDQTAHGIPPNGGTAGFVAGDRYNFSWCLDYLERNGKKMFGPHFTVNPRDHELLYTLLIYFLADEREAQRLGISLRKGLFLSGPIGCGKTSLMKLMRTVPAADRKYRIRSTRDISFEFAQDGYEVIARYSKLSYTGDGPQTYCFDDLGAEQALKLYGNECNVMAEILLSRYDHFWQMGMTTHVTSNLSASDIEEQYGPRVRSRMREMFNILAFSDETPDRRQ